MHGLLTLIPVAMLPYVVVDINASGCVALCVWLLTLMPVAMLPYVVVDINASGYATLCVCC